MSVWYVLSALGFYPVTPGIPTYAIGTPRFDHVALRLGRKRICIDAPVAEAGMFDVNSIGLNGKPLTHPFLSHAALLAGGERDFVIAREPDKLP